MLVYLRNKVNILFSDTVQEMLYHILFIKLFICSHPDGFISNDKITKTINLSNCTHTLFFGFPVSIWFAIFRLLKL